MVVLILEDDLSTALEIEMLFEKFEAFEVKKAKSINEAAKIIKNYPLDLIIADTELEDQQSSLEWLKSNASEIPLIILTNIFNSDYYDESLELKAEAYLMKPLNPVSLSFAIDRVIRANNKAVDDKKTAIQDGKKIHLITPSDVMWIHTEGNYSTIKTKTKRIVVKLSLKKSIGKLRNDYLVQAHRSAYIALNEISEIDLKKQEIIMIDNTVIPLGRAYKKNIIAMIDDYFKTPCAYHGDHSATHFGDTVPVVSVI